MANSYSSPYGSDAYGSGLYGYGTGYTAPTTAAEQSYENDVVNTALAPYPFPQITGLELKGDIVFNGLILNTIDVDGVVWVCTDIKGWWESPDPDVPDIERGYGDGSYSVRGRYQARQITLEGSILVQNRSMVAAARDKLIRAANLVYTDGWLKVGTSPIMASKVRLSGRPQIETVNTRGRTNFSIGLRAPDPTKYSWNSSDTLGQGYTLTSVPYSATSTTYTTITNVGNFKSQPYLEITGPVNAGAVIHNLTTNKIMVIATAIASGETLKIDTYERSAAVNNTYEGGRAKLDTLVDWIYLEPGANRISFYGTGTAASMKFYWRSGWLA